MRASHPNDSDVLRVNEPARVAGSRVSESAVLEGERGLVGFCGCIVEGHRQDAAVEERSVGVEVCRRDRDLGPENRLGCEICCGV
jgi:hypothetical protein